MQSNKKHLTVQSNDPPIQNIPPYKPTSSQRYGYIFDGKEFNIHTIINNKTVEKKQYTKHKNTLNTGYHKFILKDDKKNIEHYAVYFSLQQYRTNFKTL